MQRRQRRSRQEWEQLIEDQERSGKSARAYCESKAVGLASFYSWRRRIRDGASPEASRGGMDNMDNSDELDRSQGAFIEMGQIGSTGTGSATTPSPWVVTLDLGDGLKLVLQRG